jgi:UDP-N-acetylmuramate dehydrogenase
MINSLFVEKFFSEVGGVLKENVPLAPYTTYKIGGPAEYYYEASGRESLVKAVKAARNAGIPVTVLGGGSNVLIADQGLSGLVVRNISGAVKFKGMKAVVSEGTDKKSFVFVEADSGTNMNHLVRQTVDSGLAGLENHLGLPGSVGGAVVMNSKWTTPLAFVGDAVFQADILTPGGDIVTVTKDYFNFRYDYSRVQETGDLLIGVVFRLSKGSREDLWQSANAAVEHRRKTQPNGVKTAGCIFQNISRSEAIVACTPDFTQSAGYLIDRSGLKGYTIGDAVVSPDHANFFINRKNASAKDVYDLISHARDVVERKFKIKLKEEIKYLGKF